MKAIFFIGLILFLVLNPVKSESEAQQNSNSVSTVSTDSISTDQIVDNSEHRLNKADIDRTVLVKGKTDVNAQQLLEYIDSLRGYGGLSFSFTLNNISYKQNKQKNHNQLSIQVLDDSSLVEYLTPARQKGRKILKQGSNMWLHLPGTRNILRITPAQRLLGEASNGDVTGTTFSQDYQATLSGIEKLKQQSVYKLELVAKHKKTAYQKVVFYLKVEDHTPVKSDFYSRSGRLLKQAEYREFKMFNGELKLHKMLLSDPIRKGSFTWMMFDNYERREIDPAIFHKDAISR